MMEIKLECTNGYTIENPRLEGDKVLVECYPKETEDTIFCVVMAEYITQKFEESTGLDVQKKDVEILKNFIGLWSDTFDNRMKMEHECRIENQFVLNGKNNDFELWEEGYHPNYSTPEPRLLAHMLYCPFCGEKP
jgi:hypothetical protein